MDNLPRTAAEALHIIADTKMRPFDKFDWEAFAGAESANPLIGENETTGVTVIVDDSSLSFYTEFDDWVTFKLVELIRRDKEG